MKSFQKAIFDPCTFGAKADGITKDTVALQSAIDSCHQAGGGVVLLRPGVYHTNPLRLRSHVHLHLEKGAVLLGSADPLDYQPWEIETIDIRYAPYNAKSLLLAADAENVAITGKGVINGQGLVHYDGSDPEAEWWPVIDQYGKRPGRMIFFAFCRNVLIEGVTCIDSPAWTFLMLGCEEVVFRSVSIFTSYHAIHSDGIDIHGCRDVLVEACRIRTGDDAIAIRANDRMYKEPRPCEQITIRNCTLASNCNAVRLAYLADGTIRNVMMENLVIEDSRRGIFCQVPSPNEAPGYKRPHPGRPPFDPLSHPGPSVENIVVRNVTIEARQPVCVTISDTAPARCIANLTFENVRAKSPTASFFKGNARVPIENILLRNFSVQATEGESFWCAGDSFPERALALQLGYCKGVSIDNFTVEGENSRTEATLPLVHSDSPEGMKLLGLCNKTAHPSTAP